MADEQEAEALREGLNTLESDYGMSGPLDAQALVSAGRVRSWRITRRGSGSPDAYHLKVFTPGDLDRGRRESAILAHLAKQASCPALVPEVVHTAQGIPFSGSEAGLYVVTRWCPGRQVPWDELSTRDWRAIGRTLAVLHGGLRDLVHVEIRESLAGRLRERSLADERRQILELQPRMAARLARDGEGFAGLFDLCDLRLAALDRAVEFGRSAPVVDSLAARSMEEIEQPIHNDFNMYNLLIDESDVVVVDWERSILAPPFYEVVRCLQHMPVVSPDEASAFLRGYLGARRAESGGGAEPMDWRGCLGAQLEDLACKSWPSEALLAGDDWGREHSEGQAEILRALLSGWSECERFYREHFEASSNG